MADVWIKFCGCTSSSDVALAAEAGADAFGMIFAPSPRRVTWQAVNDIATRVPPSIQPVAVFVNPARGEVAKVQSLFPSAWLQFSGDESPEFVADYGERAIKAVHVGDDAAGLAEAAGNIRTRCSCSTPSTTACAGARERASTGSARRKLTKARRVVIAGGLTPENVGECVERVRPFGVDVRSGIETDGRKDIAKMRAFVRAVRRRVNRPDARGYFGTFGGRFVPEVLIAALDEVERAHDGSLRRRRVLARLRRRAARLRGPAVADLSLRPLRC